MLTMLDVKMSLSRWSPLATMVVCASMLMTQKSAVTSGLALISQASTTSVSPSSAVAASQRITGESASATFTIAGLSAKAKPECQHYIVFHAWRCDTTRFALMESWLLWNTQAYELIHDDTDCDIFTEHLWGEWWGNRWTFILLDCLQ